MPQAPWEQVAELGLPPGPDLSIWGLVTVCHVPFLCPLPHLDSARSGHTRAPAPLLGLETGPFASCRVTLEGP